MRDVSKRYRWAKWFGGRQQVLAAFMILGSMGAAASARIDVNETGLHEGQNVYGLQAPAVPDPYVNVEDILVFGWGETNPSLYSNVWFNAYGISANSNLTNSGAIGVTATGGHTNVDGEGIDTDAQTDAYGVYTVQGRITNSGQINVTASGGSASARFNSPMQSASASAVAHGLYTDEGGVDNSGRITVTAQGGEAWADSSAAANANAYGILNDNGDASNHGHITATAVGGTADTGNMAEAKAYAAGLTIDGAVDNWGNLTVVATAGTATTNGHGNTADAFATSYAVGITAQGPVNNSGSISAIATGGTAHPIRGEVPENTIAWAFAIVNGIFAPEGATNSGNVAVAATGGTAVNFGDTSAYADASGIRGYGTFNNSGNLVVTATGGTANSGTAGADANADAKAEGLNSDDLNNTGAVAVVATGGTASAIDGAEARSDAQGIRGTSVNNAGAISVTAQGGHVLADGDVDAEATAYGVFTAGGGATNSADVTVTAIGGTAETGGWATTSAYTKGIYADGDVDNTGRLTVAAIGGTATTDGRSGTAGVTNFAYTEGVYTLGMLNNSGNVTAIATTGTANDTGPVVEFGGSSAYASARGLVAEDGVTNRGNVVAVATGSTITSNNSASSTTAATGIRTFGDVSNTGNVTATATAGTATGHFAGTYADASGLYGSTVHNSGAVTIVATGGRAVAGETARVDSYAEGIAAGTVYNSGPISVTATSGTATGNNRQATAFAVGISAGDWVRNSGPITVTATAQEGFTSTAYGIRMNSFGNVTNTGVIRTTADTAYEVYVAENTTWLVDTYNVTLDGDPSRGSLAVADGATLALNNATLTVTGVTGETLWNTPYRLFDTEGSGAVDGNFASVRAINPNATATYHDQGTAGSIDDAVSLAYTPVASPALASAAVQKQVITQAADVVDNYMTVTLLQNILSPPSSGLLANAGSTAESLALAEAASDKTNGAFVQPYYSQIDQDADPLGYDASVWGFAAGYEQFVESTLLSLHLGYGQANIEYTGAGYKGNSEDQQVVSAGFSGLTRWDLWTLRYGLTGFYGLHDYQGLTGLALDEWETATYDSCGTVATLMLGRILQHDSHIFLPEVGLNWLWVHRERYTTEATDPSWDTTYSATDDYDLRAAAALRWLSSFVWHDLRVSPSVSVGVRHLLTDADTSARQSVDGSGPVLVESQQDRTAMTLSGSLVLTKTRHAVSLAYDGDYSSDARRHSVWLRYSWLF